MVSMTIRVLIFILSTVVSPLFAKKFRSHRKTNALIIEQVVAPEPKKNKKFTVHVLLEKKDAKEKPAWVITSDKGFILRDPYAPHRQDTLEGSECHVIYERGALS